MRREMGGGSLSTMYGSRVKMAGERATTRGTGFLGADGLIPALDLSGLYKYF